MPLSNRSVAGTKKQAYKILHHRSNQRSENKVCKGFLVKVRTLDLEIQGAFHRFWINGGLVQPGRFLRTNGLGSSKAWT